MTALALTGATLLGGCAATNTSLPSLPVTPTSFREAPAPTGDQPPLPTGTWWSLFSDPVLDDLIRRAGVGSTSVQLAAARLEQARATAAAAGANRNPQIAANANMNRLGGPLINAAGGSGNLFGVNVGVAYEVDIAGRLSDTAKAAVQDASSRESLLRGAHLLVEAEIAQTLFAIRGLDAERALVRDTAAALKETERLVERRYKAGLVAELELPRARAETTAADAEAFALDRRRAELEHSLALLVGESPAALVLPDTSGDARTNAANAAATSVPVIPPGIPSTVLLRRPDVVAAQSAMLAAQTRVGVARNAWFPSLSLTATGGYAAGDLTDLLRSSARAWGLGALLALPILDGGRREAGVRIAEADLLVAFTGYRERILVAFREVEDQLSALRTLALQRDALTETVTAATRAAALVESRYRNGLSNQLELLDARRTEFKHRRAALAVDTARQTATVGLVRALGGGWGDAGPAPLASAEAAR